MTGPGSWRTGHPRSRMRCLRLLGPGVARIERALYVRTGYNSETTGEYRDAAGATVAMFLQHTSREGDPQLDVHMAVMNLAQRQDGADEKWRTLHSSMLFQERLAVAVHASRELATRLTDLGYVLVPRPDGNGFETAAWTRP
jgi:conjugative relaxase-like TrwC/TraI family protein